MLLLTLAPVYVQSLRNGVRMLAVTEIRQKLREAGFQAHEREIVKLCRELGFSLLYPKNKAHVVVESEEKIVEIYKSAGFSTSFC